MKTMCPEGQSRGADSNRPILSYVLSVLPFGALLTKCLALEGEAGPSTLPQMAIPGTTPCPQVEQGKRVTGFEPVIPTWKDGVLPLHHTRESPPTDLNRRPAVYKTAALSN